MGKRRRIVPQAVLSDKTAKKTSERIDEVKHKITERRK